MSDPRDVEAVASLESLLECLTGEPDRQVISVGVGLLRRVFAATRYMDTRAAQGAGEALRHCVSALRMIEQAPDDVSAAVMARKAREDAERLLTPDAAAAPDAAKELARAQDDQEWRQWAIASGKLRVEPPAPAQGAAKGNDPEACEELGCPYYDELVKLRAVKPAPAIDARFSPSMRSVDDTPRDGAREALEELIAARRAVAAMSDDANMRRWDLAWDRAEQVAAALAPNASAGGSEGLVEALCNAAADLDSLAARLVTTNALAARDAKGAAERALRALAAARAPHGAGREVR